MTDSQKIVQIRKDIAQSYKEIKQQYPILKNQNAIGFAIFSLSVVMIVIASYWYIKGNLSIWILVPFNAFWMSILHELEHDLIHWMYFRKNKLVHNFMLFTVWILRPLTINPWLRRDLHFHHHKYSGTLHDVEERGVTNGEKWNFLRLIKLPDLIFGGLLRSTTIKKDIINEVKAGHITKAQALRFKYISTYAMLPVGIIAHLIWYIFLIHLIVQFANNHFNLNYHSPAFLHQQLIWIQPFVAILVLPNLLRQLCLHFITSNMHYFGDVEPQNILQQTQVLNHPIFLPLQFFCFFFGHTHAIHHFVVNETFYIRHITRKRAHESMKKNGVRFNDLGTFKRANRYQIKTVTV
ncbi:MAG: fatty acid desaturase [Chitinophagales bacterium]|nr:fatty acid desaturase [Chitinophagales bacterium]